jgi:DGQHR domain-containing protein
MDTELEHRDFLIDRYSGSVDLGICLAGRDLNMLVLRGYAPLDVLAAISAPDTYDYHDNPHGTQRELKPKHAKQCFEYAIESLSADAAESPHFFPEVLLNVRDASVCEVYSADDPETQVALSSTSNGEDHEGKLFKVLIRLDALKIPKPKYKPQVSRVDGNHRLHQTDQVLETFRVGESSVDDDFPVVPFSLLISVDADPEAVLFRDVNGRQEKMDTTHLENLEGRIVPEEELKRTDRPRWISRKLVDEGRAFHRKVFMGGGKEGAIREGGGKLPPIKLNALKSYVKTQLDAAPTVSANLREKPEAVLQLVDNYWHAVARSFPEAWEDRKDYILLQAIGMNAFARLGGKFMEDALEDEKGQVDYFMKKMKPIADRIDLAKQEEAWSGLAGLAGGAKVYEALVSAYDEDQARAEGLIESLFGQVSADDVLFPSGRD